MKTEQAWAAGFYDGEGCTQAMKSNGHSYIRMTVVQAEPVTLRRFQDAVGGVGKVFGPYKRPRLACRTRDQKDIYHYVVMKHADVLKIRDLLWEFLSAPKREQFTKAMEVVVADMKTRRRYTMVNRQCVAG